MVTSTGGKKEWEMVEVRGRGGCFYEKQKKGSRAGECVAVGVLGCSNNVSFLNNFRKFVLEGSTTCHQPSVDSLPL